MKPNHPIQARQLYIPSVLNGGMAMMLVAGLFFATGCKKKEVAAPVPEPQAAQVPGSGPIDPARQPMATPVTPTVVQTDPSGDMGATLANLTHELRMTLPSGHAPRDFQTLVTMRNLKVPPPPAGKKYVITKQWRVELADN